MIPCCLASMVARMLRRLLALRSPASTAVMSLSSLSWTTSFVPIGLSTSSSVALGR